tara:strand:- start:148 stop:1479 length:1332 start_codon:yes stop_codon:yes gene_type:complete
MCGIFAIFSSRETTSTIAKTIEGLKLLQHRGRDGCGIAYSRKSLMEIEHAVYKGLGSVKDVFEGFENKRSSICIGHTRYSTSGSSMSSMIKHNELQPINKTIDGAAITIVHNGNIPNSRYHDTTMLLDMLVASQDDIEATLVKMLNKIPVAYSLIIMYNETLYIVRDRFGIRPLSVAYYEDGDICISSETRPMEACRNIREVGSGEIIRIDKTNISSIYSHPQAVSGLCLFEILYFMNPRSLVYGNSVEFHRKRLGRMLGQKEKNIPRNSTNFVVVGVPDSGIIAARAYCDQMNLTYIQLIKKTVQCENGEDRTFILPSQTIRERECRKKFKFSAESIQDMNIVVIDDTIVRGTVITTIIQSLRHFGARSVHIRIPAPPIVDKCELGIAIQSREELLLYNRTQEQARIQIGADSLGYLELGDLSIFPVTSYAGYFGRHIDYKA